jgi:tetratricopeptide (TPR) repeat protein
MPSRALFFAALLAFLALTFAIGIYVACRTAAETAISLSEAVTVVESDDIRRAEVLLRDYPADAKVTDPLTLLRGYRALALGRPDDALRYFRYLKPEGELRASLLRCTGESLYKTGQLAEAEACFQSILQESPKDPRAHRWMAAIHYDLGRMDACLSHLRELSDLVPEDGRPHFMRGVIYHDFGQLSLALPALTSSLSLTKNPEELNQVRIRLAQVQMDLNDFSAAIVTLVDLPDSVEKKTMMAECFWNQGKTEEASKLISAADSIDLPARGQLLQARISLESGDTEKSLSTLKSLILEDRSSEEAEYLIAMVYQQRGEQQLYQQHLQRSEEIKALKTRLTELSSRAMAAQHDSDVRLEMAAVCDSLGMQRMANVWRQAAAACLSGGALNEEVPAP